MEPINGQRIQNDAGYVDLMNTGHPLLVNDLNVQGIYKPICKGDEQLVGHVHRYNSTLSMFSPFTS